MISSVSIHYKMYIQGLDAYNDELLEHWNDSENFRFCFKDVFNLKDKRNGTDDQYLKFITRNIPIWILIYSDKQLQATVSTYLFIIIINIYCLWNNGVNLRMWLLRSKEEKVPLKKEFEILQSFRATGAQIYGGFIANNVISWNIMA